MFFSFVIKGSGMVISLLLFPAYMKFFSEYKILGLWYTLLSVLSWILMLDFGIGNGLRNTLVSLKVEDNKIGIKKAISTTYIIAIIIAVFFLILGMFTINTINLNFIFNISDEIIDLQSLRKVMILSLFSIILQSILKIVTSILQAEHMPSLANLLGLISNCIILFALKLIHPGNDYQSIIYLSWVYLVASNLPMVIMTIIIFSTQYKDCRPNIMAYDKLSCNKVIKLGGGFFFLQLIAIIIFNTNDFLVTYLTGSENVVYYQVYYKLYNLVGSFIWIALVPMWSAITEAYEKKDYKWLKKAYKKMKLLVLATIVINIILSLSLQFLTNVWLGNSSFKINYIYACVFSVYNILYVWWGIMTSFSNGTGKIKTQLIYASIGALTNIPLAFIFFKIFHSWIGIVIANIFSMLFYCLSEPLHIKKILYGNEVKENEKKPAKRTS
jgi:O-antigen/teichoic acid export membrane protein